METTPERRRLLIEQASVIRQRQELILHGHRLGLPQEIKEMEASGARLVEIRRLLAELDVSA